MYEVKDYKIILFQNSNTNLLSPKDKQKAKGDHIHFLKCQFGCTGCNVFVCQLSSFTKYDRLYCLQNFI